MPDLVVVGAGIVGASVAYHAARLGADVAVVDRALPGSGVTGDSFAWIGASGVPPGPAAAVRRAATQEYRRLEAELDGVRVRWTGSLTWPVPPGTVPGPDQALLGPDEVSVLEPELRSPPARALHEPGDGAVDPVGVTEALVDAARRLGAQVLLGRTVTAVRLDGGRVSGVQTSVGDLPAATVVLAGGVDVPVLCAPTGFSVPVAPAPALLLRLTAPERLVRTLVATDAFEVRQAEDGTLLAALDHGGVTTRSELATVAARAVTAIGEAFRGGEDVRLVSARIGWRPMPRDGEPVVGPVPGVPGLFLTVLHAGVSLAAVVGRLAAEEVVRGTPAVELEGCRPGRFSAPASLRS